MILAIDPGSIQSGWVVFDGTKVHDSGVSKNHDVLDMIANGRAETMAIETMKPRGQPMSEQAMHTLIWVGRFVERSGNPDAVMLIDRESVKKHVCGARNVGDPNVRQALIDLIGPPGKKAAPGPTHGVASHSWAALGVAVTAVEQMKEVG